MKANLVVPVQILRIPLLELNSCRRKLRKFVDDETHLKASIASEGLICADLCKFKRPGVECDHEVAKFAHLHIITCVFAVMSEGLTSDVPRQIVLSISKQKLGRDFPDSTPDGLGKFFVKL